MLNKTTLKTLSEAVTAIGAALIALGQELQGDGGDAAPVETPKKNRRGTAPAESQPPAAPNEVTKKPVILTEAEIRSLFNPLIDIGKGAPVMAALNKLGAVKIADLTEEKQPAFVAEVKKLLTQFAAEIKEHIAEKEALAI